MRFSIDIVHFRVHWHDAYLNLIDVKDSPTVMSSSCNQISTLSNPAEMYLFDSNVP